MKKLIALTLAVVGTLNLSAENLLSNGGFENGKTDWNPAQRLVTGSVSVDTEKAVEGKQSIRLEITGKKQEKESRQALQLSSKKVAVKGGTDLYYSFQFAMENVEQGEKAWNQARIVLDFFTAEGKRIRGTDLLGVKGTADWKKYTGRRKLPDDCALVSFRILLSDAKGKIWVDDIVLSTEPVK